MATGTTYKGCEFLFRLQTQIIDGGTDILRNIFDQKLQKVPLNVFLANEQTSINRLQRQNTITKAQYDLLFPPSGKLPNSAHFDITLIICLLRNLKPFGLNQKYKWNTPPQPTDTSVEADLCRLRGFRNEIAHISSTSGFTKIRFRIKWIDIEQILLRLDKAVPFSVPGLQQTLDSYKHSPLEPAAEKRIQSVIDQWREMEKGLSEDFQLIKTDFKDVVKNVQEVKGKFEIMSKDVKDVKTNVEEVQRNNTELKHDITKVERTVEIYSREVKHVKNDVEEVQENFREVKDDVTDVRGTVEIISRDVKDLKNNVEEVQGNITGVKDDVTDVRGNVEIISRDVKHVKNNVKEVQGNIREVKDDVTEVKGNVKKVEELLSNQKKTMESDKIKDLQDDLIYFYRDQHRTISLSPLLEKETPLLEFYVMPDIYYVQNTFKGDKKDKTAVKQLCNVFYNNGSMCRKIYLTADAGLGKTAFSKRLALTWCHAKKLHINERQYFSQEDIKALNEFGFVFLLLLRNCSSDCEIDDLIWNQIILRLGHKYTHEDLVNILYKERCLVILDGLDEWTHPSNSCKQESSSIPHQKVRERTTVLTTSRPWKLIVSGLQSSQIDQKLELVGLNPESANALKKSVISHICCEKNEYMLQYLEERFTRVLNEKQISDLESIPLLLTYLLFLWCNKIELGQTQCDLYSQITELLLSRTVQNCDKLAPTVDRPQGNIPQCFSGNAHCLQFYTLLTSLGQLAYETLFSEKRQEHTLVFDGSVAEKYLTKDCLNFCLKTGLITQSKVSVPGTLLKQKSKVSFAHKTVQEFFAALYMHSTSDQISVPEIVLSKCKCIKDILEMSKLLKFSCGMKGNVSSLISREMMKIINEDEITREYRSKLENLTSYGYVSHPLKDFQDMCISCCKEIPRESEVSLCLQDVFIEIRCMQEQDRENLKQLTTRNKQNIRSLYINMYRYTPYSSIQGVIDDFALSDLENVEKIYYMGEYNDRGILPLLNKSVKCLCISCIEWRGCWCRFLREKVTSLQKVEAINISGFEISHSELKLLYDYISQRHCMRHIEMERLHCTDHEEFCTGYILDLSQHSQLKKLTLGGEYTIIPVSELNINMTSLEKCYLSNLFNPDMLLRFINSVPADSKLKTFECRTIKSSVAIETMLETLRMSVHVKRMSFWQINVGSREVLTSEMVNVQYVEMMCVSMNASVLQRIVDIIQHQPQTVRVVLRWCDIKPEDEFVTVKQKIKTSREHFRIFHDNREKFEFKTIKQGD